MLPLRSDAHNCVPQIIDIAHRLILNMAVCAVISFSYTLACVNAALYKQEMVQELHQFCFSSDKPCQKYIAELWKPSSVALNMM